MTENALPADAAAALKATRGADPFNGWLPDHLRGNLRLIKTDAYTSPYVVLVRSPEGWEFDGCCRTLDAAKRYAAQYTPELIATRLTQLGH